jgi:hypothetical protein
MTSFADLVSLLHRMTPVAGYITPYGHRDELLPSLAQPCTSINCGCLAISRHRAIRDVYKNGVNQRNTGSPVLPATASPSASNRFA